MPNNFKKQSNVDACEYRLFVAYKPEFASKREARPDGTKYFNSFLKKGISDLDGLIRRIVIDQRHEYKKALLFNKRTNLCEAKWTEGGIKESQEAVDRFNNRKK